ncbi:hypothetical protein ACFQZ4_04840 [Catellatospora coxensis]
MAIPESLLADMADPVWWAAYLPDCREFDAADDGADPPFWFEDRPPVDLPVAGGYGLRLGGRYGFWFHLLELTGPGSLLGPLGSDDGAHPVPHVFRWDEFDLLCRAMALNDPALRYPGPAAALLCRFAFLSEEEDLDAVTPVLDASLHATRPQSLGLYGAWPGAGHWLRMRDLRGTGVTWHRDTAGDLTADQDHRQRTDTLWPLHTRRRSEPRAVAAPGDDHGPDAGRPDDGSGEFPWPGWRAMLAAAELTLANAADPAWRADPVSAPTWATCSRGAAQRPGAGRAAGAGGLPSPDRAAGPARAGASAGGGMGGRVAHRRTPGHAARLPLRTQPVSSPAEPGADTAVRSRPRVHGPLRRAGAGARRGVALPVAG